MTVGAAVVALALAVAVGLAVHWLHVRRATMLARTIEALARGDEPKVDVGPSLLPALRAAQGISDELRRQAPAAREREVVLRAALEAAPISIVLFTDLGRISLANRAACELFFDGRDPEGEDFLSLLGRAPDALRRALSSSGDELFSIDDQHGERQTYHLAKRRFSLGGEPVVLVLVKNLTRELQRQEADVWKRMIRLFSHELNNSLAPVTSLLHSAQVVANGSAIEPKLDRIFTTIRERTEHLRTFLDGYARFARLPPPQKAEVAWRPFVDRLVSLWPSVRVDGALPDDNGWFDAAQIEQVLINLLKNADEAGGAPDDVTVSVEALGERGVRITVADRGPGMTEDVMKNALVPFYSTKPEGSGLGLPLCREIVEAHGGVLRLEARDAGGLAVSVRLPGHAALPEGQGKLTLTRS